MTGNRSNTGERRGSWRRSGWRVVVVAVITAVALLAPGASAGGVATGPVTPVAPRFVAPFLDVDPGSYAADSIVRLHDLGITTGTSSTTFSPGQPVTRGQMAAFLARLAGVLRDEPCASVPTPFVDVESASFAAPAVACIYGLGLTTGTAADRFSPADPVTRQQMALFLTRLFQLLEARACPTPATPFVDLGANAGANDAIACLFGLGVTTGTGATTFAPGEHVTREQMAAFLMRLHDVVAPGSVGGGSGSGERVGGGDDPATSSAAGEGSAALMAIANTSFNQWTNGGHWSVIRNTYDRLMVWSPYWDARLGEYDTVWAYRNSYGMFVDPAQDSRTTDHPEWILRDGAGDPVYIPFACAGGCARYAADVANSAFRADFVAYVQDLVDHGYGGLMLDDVNLTWRFGDVNGNDVVPIDPRTGRPMQLQDWRRYMAEFLELLRARFPDLEIVHNAIWFADTPDFDDPYVDRQFRAADVVMLERGATDAGLTGGDGQWSLDRFLRTVDRIHANGANVVLVDEGGNGTAQEYNLAATLLVNDGGDLVGTERRDKIEVGSVWAGFGTDLGHAEGGRWREGTLFLREFSRGLVVLNEPGASTVTVPLTQPMRRINGSVVTSVTLGAGQAAVLTVA